MKINYSYYFIILIFYCGISNGQANTIRFEYKQDMSENMSTFLDDATNNKIIWFDGWHEGTEVVGLAEKSALSSLFLVPNSDQLGNKIEYYKDLKKLNKSLKKQGEKVLLTWPGCAGPKVMELNENVVLIYVDTEWFFHPNSRAEFSNTKCETLWENDFWATLEDAVEDENDKLVCIVGHHSIYHESKQKGGFSFLYPYNGPSADFNSKIYSSLRHKMIRLLESNGNAVYVSSNRAKDKNKIVKNEIFLNDHEYVDFVTSKNGAVEMLSGNENNRTTLKRMNLADSEPQTSLSTPAIRYGNLDSTLVTGAEYKASWMKSFWMGKNFRNEWITPLGLDKLYVDDISGGLTPYGTGGGLQTLSLKFKDSSGRKFAFRSVNKDAKKDKERVIMQTVVGGVKQDMISSQLPFGDVVVGKLLDNTDILHSSPIPFVMARQNALGEYKEAFTHVIGTLEEKPTKKKKRREGFAGADDIVSTHHVFRRLMNNARHQIDKQAFARCIMFDIWIADWDRHHDNWKWAAYKDGKNRLYKPIPRDRDHAFSLFEGVVGNLADLAAPNVAELSPRIKDLQGMTFQGKNMLYFLGASISREEWNRAADYIASSFSKGNIEDAWSSLPIEIQEFSKEKIISALITRKDDLSLASNQLYDLYHRQATFYGSNKNDFLTIEAKAKDEVVVTLYDAKKGKKNGEAIAQKTYNTNVTKHLDIYALDGKDIVSIEGNVEAGLEIKLLPGTDKDEIRTKNKKQALKIYDTQNFEGIESIKLEKPIYPDIYGFQYDALLPFAMYKYDTDYGSGFEVKFTKVKQKFNKKPFGRSTSLAAKYYPRGNAVRLKLVSLYTDTWNKWDAKIKIRAAHNDTRYDRFLGANSSLPSNYLDNFRKGDDYYVQNDNIDIYTSMVNNIFGQSDISFGLGTQYLKLYDGTGQTSTELLGDRSIWQAYLHGDLNLDFTDDQAYPTKGVRYNISNRVGYNIKANEGIYDQFVADITLVNSWHDISKTIILFKVGGEATFGNRSYIDYPILGNGNNVRGFANNIIRNSKVGYINVELRKEIYKSKNSVLPFLLGASGFYDRGLAFENPDNNVSGYGAGLYMTFLNNAYSIFINKGFNSLNDESIIHYGLGFSL
jgi:hypothetical protein